jgi:hypothetical protein
MMHNGINLEGVTPELAAILSGTSPDPSQPSRVAVSAWDSFPGIELESEQETEITVSDTLGQYDSESFRTTLTGEALELHARMVCAYAYGEKKSIELDRIQVEY